MFRKFQDELPLFISESKSGRVGGKMTDAAAKKEKLARIVDMFKTPSLKSSQKSFAWDCVVSDDVNNKK